MLALARLTIVAALAAGLQAPDPVPRLAEHPVRFGSITVLDARLVEVMDRTADQSPQFRRQVLALAAGPIPVLVGTPAQISGLTPHWLRVRGGPAYAVAVPADPRSWASYLRGEQDRPVRPRMALVAIDLDRWTALYQRFGREDALPNELGWLLAHELAHAAGWAAAIDLRHGYGCPDPSPEEQQADPDARGCAVEQENRVRADLGIAARPRYRTLPLADGIPATALFRDHLPDLAAAAAPPIRTRPVLLVRD